MQLTELPQTYLPPLSHSACVSAVTPAWSFFYNYRTRLDHNKLMSLKVQSVSGLVASYNFVNMAAFLKGMPIFSTLLLTPLHCCLPGMRLLPPRWLWSALGGPGEVLTPSHAEWVFEPCHIVQQQLLAAEQPLRQLPEEPPVTETSVLHHLKRLQQ